MRDNVLVIGSGGREHALAWKIAQSPDISIVYVAPGNAGTSEGKCRNVDIKPSNFAELRKFASDNAVDELYLLDGDGKRVEFQMRRDIGAKGLR